MAPAGEDYAHMTEYGGYLILMAVNLGLASVVAWMLFGKRE